MFTRTMNTKTNIKPTGLEIELYTVNYVYNELNVTAMLVRYEHIQCI